MSGSLQSGSGEDIIPETKDVSRVPKMKHNFREMTARGASCAVNPHEKKKKKSLLDVGIQIQSNLFFLAIQLFRMLLKLQLQLILSDNT